MITVARNPIPLRLIARVNRSPQKWMTWMPALVKAQDSRRLRVRRNRAEALSVILLDEPLALLLGPEQKPCREQEDERSSRPPHCTACGPASSTAEGLPLVVG